MMFSFLIKNKKFLPLMSLLIQSMNYLLAVNSIDDIGSATFINHSNSNIQNIIQEVEKDFNYNDLSREEISFKKMPFINCNRKIFCNADWIDLLRSNDSNYLNSEIFANYSNIVSRVNFILNFLSKLFPTIQILMNIYFQTVLKQL